MLWDCEFCDTSKLLGLTHRHCPNCGAQQDPARRYFPDDNEMVAVEDHQYVGKDSFCPACEGPVSASCSFCGHCGSPMDEAVQLQVRKEQYAVNGAFAQDSVERAQQEFAGKDSSSDVQEKKRSWRWVVLLLVMAIVIALVYGLCFWKKEAKLRVVGHSWTRTIDIEEYRRVTESAWRDQLPARAEVGQCRREKRSSKKVRDGETCVDKRKDKGDGTFEVIKECKPRYRSEPVYDDRCSYTILRWTTVDSRRSSGRGLTPEPSWPAVNLPSRRSGIGARREGRRHARYTIELMDADDKEYTCDVSAPRWSEYSRGTALIGQVKRVTGSLDCGSLKRAR